MKHWKHIRALLFLCLFTGLLLSLAFSASAASYDAKYIMTAEKEGDLLCVLDGRRYYKAYDGEALVGYFYGTTGYSGPILVGKTAESVAFTTTWDSSVRESGGSIIYEGETYYYSSTSYFMPGSLVNTGAPLYRCSDGAQISVEQAAMELLTEHLPCGGIKREHENVEEVLIEATCTDVGRASRVCNDCGEVLETRELPERGHSFGEWVCHLAPACERAGEESRMCAACGEVQGRPVPAIEHSYGAYETVRGSVLIPPIVKEKTCELCRDVQTQEDWSYVWVTVLAAVAAVGLVFGVIGYVRAFKRK